MSNVSGRVVCPRCGANNFNTQAACWKCGAALSGPAAAAPQVPNPPPSVPPSGARLSPGPNVPPPSVAPSAPYTPAAAPAYSSAVDPALAFWSTIALAFFFPGLAVPVGLVFLMLDDRRKAEIGRLALIWGIVFSLVHLLATWWMVQGTVMALRAMLPSLSGRTQAPGMNDRVPPLNLPGIPSAGTGASSAFPPAGSSSSPFR